MFATTRRRRAPNPSAKVTLGGAMAAADSIKSCARASCATYAARPTHRVNFRNLLTGRGFNFVSRARLLHTAELASYNFRPSISRALPSFTRSGTWPGGHSKL
jgi:hypothetical protein